ncbi:response regulator [Dissulfurirhabdus thermomarina]|uniref:Response regulator n=1 Tax=Dissulfurirhabdus thermomarina TaxID=1765737 RepID=A0A6N9TV01_DISTH|nr:response regulator [Dissulfurirhabdus thermomarina]NDY43257.1 response regulator [Dissulfurirhabdus thermomarina]NMX23124.1 response regulator [Dissulfurirhabdus thermomarina]
MAQELGILVMDDAEDVTFMLRQALSGPGRRVDTARDGREGLRLAGERVYDLFVVDLVMPRMNGYEVCRALREIPRYRRTPILVLTGRDDPGDRDLVHALGVEKFLTKPVAVAELKETVDRILCDRMLQELDDEMETD